MMISLLSAVTVHPLSFCNRNLISLKSPSYDCRPLRLTEQSDIFTHFNPLRVPSSKSAQLTTKMRGRSGPVCYYAPLTASNLQWVTTVASAVLMLARGTAIQKSFLVPLFVLQAHPNAVYWIKGNYGLWTAFLALLVRLFFSIPGELELPFLALLLVIVAPHEAMNLRSTQGGIVLSLMIAGYLAFQHFTRAGSLKKAFDQGSIIATLSIICIAAFPWMLLA
ncbi:cold-regulated 413 inner membrane protein 1, chloroplastic-like [Impatiens glandulifera]|uniref:cold-regulated 413 inner membrane protein 1, chloroplastic-like n=1 Tax=Impatiens glandulifera TaxID=253017 RepID=UPI001FB0C464|nr:cold-regulated 413 inner membrane protein 1, chloroplastic-like [Impatiens glandulifera]